MDPLSRPTEVASLLSDSDAEFCDLATQLQTLTGQHIAIRDGKAVITDTVA